MSTDLAALPTVHDLPPKWDGRAVRWDPWVKVWSSGRLHAPAADLACAGCGLIDDPWRATGWVVPLPGETFTVDAVRHTRSGRSYVSGATQVQAYPLSCLHATRCPSCGRDEVHDTRTGETWVLGPEDYGPDGSREITGSLW